MSTTARITGTVAAALLVVISIAGCGGSKAPSEAEERCAQATDAADAQEAVVTSVSAQLDAIGTGDYRVDAADGGTFFTRTRQPGEYTDEELRASAETVERLKQALTEYLYLIVGDPECFDPAEVADARAALDTLGD